MVENCEWLWEYCILFVGCFQIWFINFLKVHFIVFDSQPIVPDTNILNFKFLIDLYLFANIILDVFAHFQNVLIYLQT